MAWQDKLEIDRLDEQLENELIVHKPEVYLEMKKDPRDNIEVEEFVPETVEDVQSMLAEIQREGFLD
jgi:hypothetical protein